METKNNKRRKKLKSSAGINSIKWNRAKTHPSVRRKRFKQESLKRILKAVRFKDNKVESSIQISSPQRRNVRNRRGRSKRAMDMSKVSTQRDVIITLDGEGTQKDIITLDDDEYVVAESRSIEKSVIVLDEDEDNRMDESVVELPIQPVNSLNKNPVVNSINPSWKENLFGVHRNDFFFNCMKQIEGDVDLSDSSEIEVLEEVKCTDNSKQTKNDNTSNEPQTNLSPVLSNVTTEPLTQNVDPRSRKQSTIDKYCKKNNNVVESGGDRPSSHVAGDGKVQHNYHSLITKPLTTYNLLCSKQTRPTKNNKNVQNIPPVVKMSKKQRSPPQSSLFTLPPMSLLTGTQNKHTSSWERYGQNLPNTTKQSQSVDLHHIGQNVHSSVSSTVIPTTGLRPIIIDGSNVALQHTMGKKFSVKGLSTCIDYFQQRGHRVIAFIPKFRERNKFCDNPTHLKKLIESGVVICTPSRYVDGRLISPYDDRYIIQTAVAKGGVIVTTDNYTDLLHQHESWDNTIKYRLLNFTWVDDMIMFPQDPLGKNGPKLQEFLKFS